MAMSSNYSDDVNRLNDENGYDMELDIHEKESKLEDDYVIVPPENASRTKRHKTGVIYLSRIPRGMTVLKLTQMLSQYGEVNRIYLKPKGGDDTKKRSRAYTEGWVEFERKRVAKTVCGLLNNTIVDGRRKNPWKGELWNMKYMKRLKWNDLQRKITVEKKIQDSKIRMAIVESKKKVDGFSKYVSREKFLNKLESEGKPVQRHAQLKGDVKVTKPWKEKPRAQNDSFLSGLFVNGMT